MDARRAILVSDVAKKLAKITTRVQPGTHSLFYISNVIQSEADMCREAVQCLQRHITTLHTIHNLIFPFATILPVEVVRIVFSYLYDPQHGRQKNADFFNAMSTCRQWREVACDMPRCWTRVRVNNLTLTEASLVRSKVRPLQLFMDDNTCDDVDAAVELLKKHAHRIKSLDAHHTDPLVLERFFDLLDVPAPELESLSIRYTEIGASQLELSSVFAGQMPSLRSLKVDRVSFPFDRAWSAGLLELHMRDALPPLPALLDLLSGCTQLQKLVFYGYHLWPGAEQLPPQRMVSLPSLKELSVQTEPIGECGELLDRLILPETARLQLEVDVMTDDNSDLPDLVSSFNLPCVIGLRRLEILWDARRRIFVRAFRDPQQHLVPDFEMTIGGVESLADIPTSWPFDATNVETLVVRLGHHDRLYFESWDFLLETPNVTTLRVIELDEESAKELLSRGLGPVKPDPPITAPFLYCPGLETVELFDLEWSDVVETRARDMIMLRRDMAPGALKRIDVYDANGAPVSDVPEQVEIPGDDTPVLVAFYD